MEDITSLEDKINRSLNLVFCKHPNTDPIIFENLYLLKKLFLQTEQNLFELESEPYKTIEIDWNRITEASFLEKVNIISEFFAYFNIPFDINRIISDGTLNIKMGDIQDQTEPSTNGYYDQNNNHSNIEVYNNGLLTDAVIWVHEITHYRNLMEHDKNNSSHHLTEALAFTYEFIFADYLKKEGYIYESTMIKLQEARSLFYSVYDCYYIINFMILYDEFGCINKENYIKLFNRNDYEEAVEKFDKIVTKRTISTMIDYSLAASLSMYMYEEYKKDNSFLTKIEQICTTLQDMTFEECLANIGIIKYNNEEFDDFTNIEKIKMGIKYFMTDIHHNILELEIKEKRIQ